MIGCVYKGSGLNLNCGSTRTIMIMSSAIGVNNHNCDPYSCCTDNPVCLKDLENEDFWMQVARAKCNQEKACTLSILHHNCNGTENQFHILHYICEGDHLSKANHF